MLQKYPALYIYPKKVSFNTGVYFNTGKVDKELLKTFQTIYLYL